MPKLKVAKIESCQIWKLTIESGFCISCQKLPVLMNSIESCQNWKLTKLKVAEIESCQNWKFPILKDAKVESEFSISC